MKSLGLFALIIALLLNTACGGASQAQVKELNITLDLPAGWSAATDTYGGNLVAEITAKGSGRVLKISEAKNKAASLEELVKAMSKDSTAFTQETLPKGFGGTFQKKSNGEKSPVYVINANGKTYNCEPGPYYDEKVLADAIKVCKSIR